MKSVPPHALALEAPDSSATLLTNELIQRTLAASRESPRGRIIQRLHKSDDDPFHRMLNAMQPGTYFRAHRHLDPPKSETMLLLGGALRVVLFDASGTITAHHDLEASGPNFGIDLLPQVYHTILCLKPDTIMLEAKTGPYTQATDKDFPDWAPPEDTPQASQFLDELMALTSSD